MPAEAVELENEMPKISFHKLAALVVLVASTAWVATGEFSSAGSAAEGQKQGQKTKPADKAEAKASVTVAVIDPKHEEHARLIRISGQTEADKRSVLATRVAGVVTELPVKQGDRVKQGDIVLKLDAEGKGAAVDTARQLLSQRKAEADAAERLTKSGSMAKLQLDNAHSALAQAKSGLEEAQAELDRLEVKAPFAGVVDRVAVEKGASLMQGGQVATLIKLDPIIAAGEISERDIGYVRIGDKADVRLVDDRVVSGTIRYISRDASDKTRTFRIEVAVPNPDNEIPAGMTAEIAVQAKAVDTVLLPRSVVTLSADGDLGVRAVNRDDKVTFHPIDLVDDTPKGLYLGGVDKDLRIIVAGQDLVTEGETVNPVAPDEATLKRLAGGDAAIGSLD